jgi:predicted secreted Zn-dependent protease
VKALPLVFILFSFYSSAETNVFEEFNFYEVAPTSKNNLLKALNSSSPIKENGEVFHGHTKYSIDWRFWWKSNGNKCTFTNVVITLKLKYTMPQLRSSKPDIKAVWLNWYPNLEKHEKGHGNLAKNIANEINRKLLAMSPKPNCNILEKSGNELAYKLMGKLKKANQKYDAKTNHGETQNAWLYLHL